MAMDYGEEAAQLVSSDLRELGHAAKNLAKHAFKLAGFGTTFLQWLASISAIYLLILDRTNWKTNILTSLLIPYIFLSLPSIIFSILRGELGKWIAFVAVVLRLFFPRRFPDWLELPGALILLIVVAPINLMSCLSLLVLMKIYCLVSECLENRFCNVQTNSCFLQNSSHFIKNIIKKGHK